MTTSEKLLTADDLWNMPANGKQFELFHGELRRVSPTNFGHGNIAGRIIRILDNFVYPRKLGTVGPEIGFVLSDDKQTVLAPDVAFVNAERIPSPEQVFRFFQGHPDLAVEVLSPTDTSEEVDEKIQAYLESGTKLVWIVNPKTMSVTVYRRDNRVTLLRSKDMISGEDVIQGFECAIAEFFA